MFAFSFAALFFTDACESWNAYHKKEHELDGGDGMLPEPNIRDLQALSEGIATVCMALCARAAQKDQRGIDWFDGAPAGAAYNRGGF